ncbi:hypothetical protein STTU_5121 [Streptomyces sp. Tu6071]|uniref:WhiB family transcriptional regulator n=1 Tax=Streptomyces sp. Tu6071 TaxID=355249 RepID=UPI00020E61CC|nr:WhiB family transcriptional regulator [Streptomyces sp. Tu6071]EGJ77910.1 hypothetical protein STTU_5121 [Streptomyces sp. Tu6071]
MSLDPTRYVHRLLGDQTWQADAVCHSTPYHQVDPEIFFPVPDDAERIAAAKSLCAQCPVRRACLDAALETRDTWGIRGGVTEEERATLHEGLADRLDRSRVAEALDGRDIHLSAAERKAVAAGAHRQGYSKEKLARILKITPGHAQKMMRAARRAEEHRANAQGGEQDDFGTAA